MTSENRNGPAVGDLTETVTLDNCGGTVTVDNCGGRAANAVRGSLGRRIAPDWVAGISPPRKPSIDLWIELEEACNLSCSFCYNPWRPHGRTPPAVLPRDALLAGVDQLQGRFRLRNVALTGGEPLLAKDLERVVQHFVSAGAQVVIATNGTLLTPQRSKSLATAGVATVQISLHSHVQETHDELTERRGSWLGAVRGIRAAVNSGIAVVPVFVATSVNVAHFPKFVEWCVDEGYRQVIFNRFTTGGMGTLNFDRLSPAPDDVVLALASANRVARTREAVIDLGIPVSLASLEAGERDRIRSGSCTAQGELRKLSIGPDGALRLCNHSADTLGGLLEGDVAYELVGPRSDGGCHFEGKREPVQLIRRKPS